MRKLFTILIFLSINLVKADFVPIDFVTLTHRADKIAYGEIICVDENVFELKIDKSLYPTDKILTINKFRDWTCAVRWSDYFVGQHLMVFLSEDEDGLYPIGAGNEGELPIFKGRVYPSAITWPFEYGELKEIRPQPEHKKFDSDFYMGIELELSVLWEYIQTIKECFECDLIRYSRVKSAKWTCSIEKAEELKKRNKLYLQTFERLITDANKTYN